MTALRLFSILVFLLLAGRGWTEENLLKNTGFSRGIAEWSGNSRVFQTEGNSLTANVSRNLSSRGGEGLLSQSVTLRTGKRYRLSFRIGCREKGVFRVVYQKAKSPYTPCGLAENWTLDAGEHSLKTEFVARSTDGVPGLMTFNFSRLPGKSSLSAIRLEEVPGIPFALSPEWSVFCDAKGPSVLDRIPERLNGKAPLQILMTDKGIDFRKYNSWKFQPNRSVAVLYNRFQSRKEGVMRIGFSADWFFDIYLNGIRVLSSAGTKPFSPDHCFGEFPVKKGENLLVAVVRAGSGGWGFCCGAPREPLVFRNGRNGWKQYQMTTPEILPGSALDLSGQVEAPAGKSGRLTISEEGELVFEDAPGQPVRMLGFNDAKGLFEAESDALFRERAGRFARAARRQGYRLFRVHSLLDRWLCHGSKTDQTINPLYLDRWDYLISELKKEGIYLHLVIFSFHLYQKSGIDVYKDRNRHKLMMYLEGEWEMNHFRYAVNTLFNHVNPYTGLAWKDEPAIAWVEYYNEQAMGLLKGQMRNLLRTDSEVRERLLMFWRAWLAKKYGKPMPDAEIPLTAGAENERSANDFALFWMERAEAVAKRCGEIIRRTGYRGLVTNYSASKNLGHSAARWTCAQVVDGHAYFNHPTHWMQRGSVVGANSSIEENTGYWKEANSTKLVGRPFLVGEYNHCFWNPFRYESGMVFGAYSALQGYGALEIHALPILLNETKMERISCFSVGNSPLLRASQFLTACLFQRGDVKTSPHLLSVMVPNEFLMRDSHAEKAVSASQASLALLAGYGLLFPERAAAQGTLAHPKADLVIPISGSAEIQTQDWFSNLAESGSGSFSLPHIVKEMKRKGILSPQNISDPEKGIFQSDTEELILRSGEKRMSILTPRTEAVCMTAGGVADLNTFSVRRNSADSCIAFCSVDGMPLSQSRRIVILYLTEEANSGMTLAANRATLLSIGSAPALARTGILELTIRRQGSWKLHALGINGSRREKVALSTSPDGLFLHLDTAALRYGPTPFFELIQE